MLYEVITSGNAEPPEIPMLDGFQIVGTSRSSQTSIINGNISSQAIYYYMLQPFQTNLLDGQIVTENIQSVLDAVI